MSCASYMQRRVCADAVQSFAPKAKRCSLSDSFSQQETCWPGGRRSARCSLDRRPVLQSDPRNCALVHRRNHAEARKSGRLRYGQTQLRAPSAAVTGAVSRIAEASVAKESRKGRLQSLQGLPEMRGLRLHLYKKQALKTPLGRCCNAVQGGDSQGNRGTTGRSETAGPEAASSREEEGEAEKLSEKEESATEKLLREMREKAEEQARKDKEANALYKYGQREYGRGEYAKAVEALQSAVDLVTKGSALGGEMQIWLAMAFDANGQRADGLATYRKLEATHPMKEIKLQAANLRYIMEAPRLKISKDERVTIPLVGEESQSGKPSFTEQYKERRRANYRKNRKFEPDIWDRIEWKPPRWQKNPYVWVAFTLWLTLIAVTMAFGD